MATYAFVLTDRSGNVLEDVSGVAADAKGAYRICRPSRWEITVPISGDDAVGDLETMSQMLKVYRDSVIVHNGFVRTISRKGDLEKASAVILSEDPMVWWWFRRFRDSTGNYALPTIPSPVTGGELLFGAITNSIVWENMGLRGIYGPYTSEMGIALGSDTSTADLSSTLGDFPLSIGEVAVLIGATAMCEFRIDPIDNGPGTWTYGTLNVYDRMGADKRGSLSLDYGGGAFNVQEATYSEDARRYTNALRYLLGPKLDPEHWVGSVDGQTLSNFVNPPQQAILDAVIAARTAHGYWHDIRFFDDLDPQEDLDNPASSTRKLYRRLWQLEQSLRLRPKRLLNLTPTPEGPRPFVDLQLGDLVSVSAPGLGVSLGSVSQRVYGFDITPTNDNVEEMGPYIVSPDGEEVL